MVVQHAAWEGNERAGVSRLVNNQLPLCMAWIVEFLVYMDYALGTDSCAASLTWFMNNNNTWTKESMLGALNAQLAFILSQHTPIEAEILTTKFRQTIQLK